MARPVATTRAQIDVIGLDLIIERGFANLTSRDLAAACGISRPTLFRYLPRMSDLVLDQIIAFGDLTVERFNACDGDPWETLSNVLVSCYAELRPDTAMGKAFTILARDPELRARSGLLAREWRNKLAVILRGQQVGDDIICQAVAGSAIGIVNAAFARAWPPQDLARALGTCRPAVLSAP